MKKYLLGVKIDDVDTDQAVEIVQGWLSKSGKHYVVTPNPEFLIAAQNDTVFKKILNDADLSIPDGVGLRFSGKIKNRVAGIDLMDRLIKVADEKGYAIGLIGGKRGIAQKAGEALRKRYPKLIVKYAVPGPVIPAKAGIYTNNSLWIPDQVRDDKIDILFVGFGMVKQEKWIANNLKDMPMKVAMGVGGAFDYLSGSVPRAPRILRLLGLEWLFRLIIEPWRIKRQFALVKYIWLTNTHHSE